MWTGEAVGAVGACAALVVIVLCCLVDNESGYRWWELVLDSCVSFTLALAGAAVVVALVYLFTRGRPMWVVPLVPLTWASIMILICVFDE